MTDEHAHKIYSEGGQQVQEEIFDTVVVPEGQVQEVTFDTTPEDVEGLEDESFQQEILTDGNNDCHSRTIKILLPVYMVLVVLLFVLPQLVPNNDAGEGFGQIARVLSIILIFGIAILGVSIASLAVTIHGWSQLSGNMRALGLFPLFFSIVIVIIVALLTTIASSSSGESPDPCMQLGNATSGMFSDCPTPKNFTVMYSD